MHKIEITEKEYEAYQYQKEVIANILSKIEGLSDSAISLMNSTISVVEEAENEANTYLESEEIKQSNEGTK